MLINARPSTITCGYAYLLHAYMYVIYVLTHVRISVYCRSLLLQDNVNVLISNISKLMYVVTYVCLVFASKLFAKV